MAERLQRYGFARDLKPLADTYTLEEIESEVKKTRIAIVNGQKEGDKGYAKALKDKRFNFLRVQRAKGAENNQRSDL